MADIINRVLSGQFRVDAFIASGGMGAVYRVWDLKRNVPLAMKVLHTDLSEDPTMFKRFKREANALKKLAHPNIVPFYGLYQTADFAFLLERYVDGPSLKEILRERHGKPMAVEEVLVYLKALSAALGYAHAFGVVHCDVKPGNVMVDQGGNIYLTDFGIARHSDSTTTTLATVGTAAYMAPEQIRGEAVSPATDVYALGVMLFEMLTGQRPFKGDEKGTESGGSTANERIRYAHLTNAPPDPRTYNPALSPATADVILKALTKNPAERFASTGELFSAFCSATGIGTALVSDRISREITGSSAGQKGAVSSSSHILEMKSPTTRGLTFLKSWPGWITGGALCLLIIIAIAYQFKGSPQDQTGIDALTGPTVAESSSPPTSAPSHTSIPTKTATLIPTPTVIPTDTSVPTVTSTPPEIRKAEDGADLVFVPAGEFIMGSDASTDPYFWGAEGPPHRVYLDGFWIYRMEVTNAMYQACVAQKACPRPAQAYSNTRDPYYGNADYASYPVIYVDYVDALSYCQWAGGRLPTEAEWEKAARGTDQRLFPWGDDLPAADKLNFCDWNCPFGLRISSVDDGYRDTAPVGSYPAGASLYSVLDMAGNVSEWTADWMGTLYYQNSPEKNPLGPASGTRRVVRGGSWGNPTDGVRTTGRFSVNPTNTVETIGFRCVYSP